MEITAAFHWDARSKSIRYLIVNTIEFEILAGPLLHKISNDNFKEQAEKVINGYFQKLIKLQPNNIILEYKILADAAPVYPTAHLKPLSKSEFIKTLYRKKVDELEQQFRVKRSPQVNSLLEGQSLELFKTRLFALRLINTLTKDAYKWHLWSIFLHATNSAYEELVRKKLWRPIVDSANNSRGNEKRYIAWSQQA
ncbi:TPA: hypothetical protein I8Z56_002735 [Legionella pneumophila]|nr:hypothetical protein [Legionella pneumophila]HAT3987157.1 hypothetical protein [Legionella pneumophila]HAU1509871.1 hypothetical protein [Legionella pneumophila]